MSEIETKFDQLLQKSAELRGHLCIGLPLGLKIALLGLRRLNMEDKQNRRNLMVFVEVDRCIADAIQIATGCTAGSRSLKMLDYGKFAATFVDTFSGRGVRIVAKRNLLDLALKVAVSDGLIQEGENVQQSSPLERKILMHAYTKMPAEDLLEVEDVEVPLAARDLPGGSSQRVVCSQCGESIIDNKGVIEGGEIRCKACAYGTYHRRLG